MPVSIDQLLGWSPDGLAGVVDNLIADRTTLLDLQDELYAARPPASWHGDDAAAALDTYQLLRDQLNDFVAPLSRVISAIDDASTVIAHSKEDVLSVTSSIEGRGWIVEEGGGLISVTDPTEADPEDDATRAEYADLIARALGDAHQADVDLNHIMTIAGAGVFDGGTSSLGDAALPEELQGMSDGELIDYFMANPETADTYTGALSVHQRQLLAEALASDTQGLVSDEEFYNTNPHPTGPPTQQQLERWALLLDAYGSDPVVSTAFLETVGPTQLLQMQTTLQMDLWPSSDDDQWAWEDGTLGDLQSAMGQLLASGTAGTTLNSDATDTAVSADWVYELTALGTTPIATGPGMESMLGFSLLGPLLGDDGHGSFFLNTVGTAMEDFEQEWLEDYDISPWVHDGDQEGFVDFTNGTEEGTPYGNDPFAGLFEGLSHNPDAARQFFTGGEDRVDWYLTDRPWETYSNVGSQLPSSIEQLGFALETATLVDPTSDSARIVEEIVAATAGDNTPFDPVLAGSMGNITAGYMPDVFAAMVPQQDHNGTEYLGDAYDPSLQAHLNDQNALAEFLGMIGADEDAGNVVNTAALTYASFGYDAYFNGTMDGPGDSRADDDPTLWDQRADLASANVTEPWSDVVGALGDGYGDQLVSDTEESDSEHNSEGDWAWTVGGKIVDEIIPAGNIPFVGGFVEYGQDQVVDGIVSNGQGLNDVDNMPQVQDEIGNLVTDQHVTGAVIAENAVYANLPDSVLQPVGGGVFYDESGARIPMAQWGEEQIEAWLSIRDETGPAAAASTVGGNVEEYLSSGYTEANQEDGEN